MKEHFTILIVEDSNAYRETVVELLGVYNEVQGVASLTEAREALKRKTFDVIVLDKHLPDGESLALMPEIRAANPNAVIIMLTADRDFGSVKKCIAAGADDYVIKGDNVVPDLLVRLPLAVARAATERRLDAVTQQMKQAFRYEIIGKSLSTVQLREQIANLRGCTSHVLITGESGTGKELIARRLHAIEGDRAGSFVPVNCAAIPESLVESELFGHKKGSFTGAVTDQRGKFEEANKGVIFLDEVGDLPLKAQTKLLRVLEDGILFRVGDTRPIHTQCRVVAGTNKDLEDLVRKRLFREDLYYRLNVVRIQTTPLRGRSDDIPDLAHFFLVQLGGPKLSIAEPAIKKLAQHDWPGNIRELRNTIERAIIAARQRKSLQLEHEDISIHQPLDGPDAGARRLEVMLPTSTSELTQARYEEFLRVAEREYLRAALNLVNGSARELAEHLQMSRSFVFKRMTKAGIERRPYGASRSDEEVNELPPGLKGFASDRRVLLPEGGSHA
jgi:DNA-binding NtrC family response regulator